MSSELRLTLSNVEWCSSVVLGVVLRLLLLLLVLWGVLHGVSYFIGDVVGVDVVSFHVVVVERIMRALCDQNALGRRPIL